MKITNKLNLPQPFVSAVEREYEYTPKRYSVTSVLKGAREAILQRRHADEIEGDVSEMVWAIFGSAVHSILESADGTETQVKENKLVVPMPNGYELSGIFDLYDEATNTVTDYKTASVWKFKFGEFDDWRMQVLAYCWMLRKLGHDARYGQIVALLKDHSKSKAKIGEHPPYPVQTVEWVFTERDFQSIEEWLNGRFAQLEACEQLPDDELPLCTEAERWTRGEAYAVKSAKAKRAKKVFKVEDFGDETEARAREYAAVLGNCIVEHRPGIDVKCMDYCSAAPFCSHYREIKVVCDGE